MLNRNLRIVIFFFRIWTANVHFKNTVRLEREKLQKNKF